MPVVKSGSAEKAGHCSQVVDLDKTDGLDLHQPQGALAVGQWGLEKMATMGRAS